MASNVAALVAEMSDTLSAIRQTMDALSETTHSSRLDQLEHQRDSTLAALRANFERETDDLGTKRRKESEDIAERRRKEDEEIRERRRREDDDIGMRDEREDGERETRFVGEMDDVEDELDGLMEEVEADAEAYIADGRDKLARLEERRKELNRLIDEQVRVPLPTVPTRRRSRTQRTADAAITSKPVPTRDTAVLEPVSNSLKATKVAYDDGGAVAVKPPQLAGRGDGGSEGGGDEGGSAASGDATRGSFESGRTARSRVGSVSSLQRGSRISAFGWFAGKIGLGEVRDDDSAPLVAESPDILDRDEDVSVVIREIPGHLSSDPGDRSRNGFEETEVDRVEPAVKDASSDDVARGVESIPSDIVPSDDVILGNGETVEHPTAPEDQQPGYGKHESDNADEILELRTFSSHEDMDIASSDSRDLDEPTREPSKVNDAVPTPISLHDTPEQSGLGYGGESHEPDSASYGHTSELGSHNYESTASSREGSYVETGPATSETTLDVGYETYTEEVVEIVHEKGAYRDMDDELEGGEDVGVEMAREEDNEHLDQEEYEYGLRADPVEINSTAIHGETLAQAVYEDQSPTAYTASRDAAAFEEGKNAIDRKGAVFENYNDADADYGAYTDVDDASESASDVALDQILTVTSQPLTAEVVAAPKVPESHAAVFHDVAESENENEPDDDEPSLGRGVERSPEIVETVEVPASHEVVSYDVAESEGDSELDADDSSSLGRGVEEEALVSSYAEEVMDLTDGEVPGTPGASEADVATYGSEAEVDEPASDAALGEQKTTPELVENYLPIELPPHAMEYSSGPDSAQLPDGTWSLGSVDEELYRSLIARFMVPAALAAEVEAQDDVVLSVPSLRAEESLDDAIPSDSFDAVIASSNALEDAIPNDSFDPVVSSSDEEIRDDVDRDFVYSSFAHDIQPASVQLESGAWSVDPSDEELETASLQARERGESPAAEPHQEPVDISEGVVVDTDVGVDSGMPLDVSPASTQLPSGVWVVEPLEEDYEVSAPLVWEGSTKEHYRWVEDGSSSPSDIHHKSSEEMGLPSPVEAVHSPIEALHSPVEVVHSSVEAARSPVETVYSPVEAVYSPVEATHLPLEAASSPVDAEHLREIRASPDHPKNIDSFSQEQDGSASGAEMGGQWDTQEDTLSLRDAESQSGQESPDAIHLASAYEASQAEEQDAATLPWSPFNNRIPLPLEVSSGESALSPSLEEAHEGERSVEEDITRPQDRHATFGYDKGPVPVDDDVYSDHNIPNSSSIHTDKLNVTEAMTDTESQAFMTPLQSAGIYTPPQFQEQPDLFHNAVDYARSDTPPEENATTVRGHDALFDSDDESDYEPDVSVDENGEPTPNLGVPPQHHGYDLGHGEEAADTPITAALHVEVETEAPLPARNTLDTQPSEEPEDNSDVSPLYLRQASPEPDTPRRGLAFSRHNPERPITPPSQTIPEYMESPGTSWDASARMDSTPMSLVSHSTVSSSPGSPTQDMLPIQSYEPSIQGPWSTHIRNLSEARDPHHDDERGYHDHEPTEDSKRFEESLPTPIATRMPLTYSPSPSASPSPASPSPSTLISRMRGMFEKPVESSSPRSRPSSGVFNGSRPSSGVFSGSRPQSGIFGAQRAPVSPGYDVAGEPRKGGFLNEMEDEVDERSALLGVGRG